MKVEVLIFMPVILVFQADLVTVLQGITPPGSFARKL